MTDFPITEQQISSIRKLCEHLRREAPDFTVMSYYQAKAMISTLLVEYRAIPEDERRKRFNEIYGIEKRQA